MMKIQTALTALILLISAFPVAGQEQKPLPKHHEDHYHLSMFAGFSTDFQDNTGYKLGIEYEYRINKTFGAGGTFDFTGKDFKILSLSAGVTTYPFEFPLILSFGVGAKYKDEKWKPFIRGIINYDFHIGAISLGPMIMYDIYFSTPDILSPGITIGFGL
jgi:hypothetical protein